MFQFLLFLFAVMLIMKLLGYASDLQWKWVFLPVVLIIALPAFAFLFFVIVVRIGLSLN